MSYSLCLIEVAIWSFTHMITFHKMMYGTSLDTTNM